MVDSSNDTAQRILDVAEGLLQTRGFNGFSYADISEALKITKPSIHHHFPAKADLGLRLIKRYHEGFFAALAGIDQREEDARDKLREYARLYTEVLRQEHRMCLCGMLAADFSTLAAPIRDAVQRFFRQNEIWLAGVLEDGRRKKQLSFDGPPDVEAGLFLSSLQGAMLVARSLGDVARFEALAARLLGSLAAAKRAAPKKAHSARAGAKRSAR